MAATKIRLYQDAIRHLADARLALITDDVESRYALDDAWEEAVTFVLRLAPWRFALVVAAPAASGTPAAGFTSLYAFPADWLRTQSIFVLSGSIECPLDIRETGINFSANVATGIRIRYVSSTFSDPALALNPWPEHFAQLVAAYLAFLVAERVTGERSAAGRMSDLFSSLLEAAIAIDAAPPDPWLRFMRDGRFMRGARFVLSRGFWSFALTVATPTATGTAHPGFSSLYPYPADWIRTHAIFVLADTLEAPIDIRATGVNFSANASTGVRIRYVSSAVDSTKWPESFTKAVRSYLELEEAGGEAAIAAAPEGPARDKAGLWQAALGAALEADSIAGSPWLAAQLDGRFMRAARFVLSRGFWRFALNSATPTPTGGAFPGFSTGYAFPTDWLRTHAIFVLSGARECPIDCRETGVNFSANIITGVRIRYVSRTVDATKWPESFTKAVLSYLAFEEVGGEAAREASQEAQTRAALWQAALSAALEADSDADNPWLVAQLDGSFQRAGRELLGLGCWRFALKTAALAGGTTGQLPLPGFTALYSQPADWLKTHSLFVLTGERERPIDIREHGSTAGRMYSVNNSPHTIYIRYVATGASDTTLWPEPFFAALRARLDFERAQEGEKRGAAEAEWQRALAQALAQFSEPESPFLKYQLDGRLMRAGYQVLALGYWQFALTTAVFQAATADDPAEPPPGIPAPTVRTPAPNYPYRFDLPADWLRTHAAFVPQDGTEAPIDIREDGQWSTTAPYFAVRYMSGILGAETARWTDQFLNAVMARIECDAAEAGTEDKGGGPSAARRAWQEALAEGLMAGAIRDDPWWRFQRDGRWLDAVKYVLAQGRWRFAMKTLDLSADLKLEGDGSYSGPLADTGEGGGLGSGQISPGMTALFFKPGDWLRTIWLYRALGHARADVEFRDEGGALHALYDPLVLRYMSRDGLDATRWPAPFRNAVLTWLEYEEMRSDPKLAGVATAKLALHKDQFRMAEFFDDTSEVPRVNTGSRFVAARYRRGSGGPHGDGGSSDTILFS